MNKRYGMLIVSVTILVLGFVVTASATNWSVDGSGGADFTGIQDAINNASDGDTILVSSGVYYENVVVGKSVTLKGIEYPIVDAGGEGNAIRLTADGITLVGFNATNAGSSLSDDGIKVTSNNNTITGNNVSNNNRGGISLNDYNKNNTITGNNISNNGGSGIYLLSSNNNNTVTGNNISNNSGSGIYLDDYNKNNTITGNNISNNGVGIYIYNSSNNSITGNTHVNDGLSVYFSYQNTVEDNTVNGKPLVYLKDVSDYKVEDAGQIILVNCTNITVENLDLYNTRRGIDLWETKDCIISNNKVCSNKYGIRLSHSSNNNTITGNKVRNNTGFGIYLASSSNNNTITGNNVSNNNLRGIGLSDSSNNNTITDNNVSNNNRDGIRLDDSSNNNTITGNNVCSNNWSGISLSSSRNNKIYFNNFINNSDNVDSYKSTNIWNSPLEITYTYDGNAYTSYIGNYWDDYEGTDAEGDGIGNTPYSIDSEKDECDVYPLMQPFENYFA